MQQVFNQTAYSILFVLILREVGDQWDQRGAQLPIVHKTPPSFLSNGMEESLSKLGASSPQAGR